MNMIEQFQKRVDNTFGKYQWEVRQYKGMDNPLVVSHWCGTRKYFKKASFFLCGLEYKCASCEPTREKTDARGRKKLKFEDLEKRISEETYGTYELVEMTDSTDFIINHKSCDRLPFRTDVSRFFSRGQRCQCTKKGKVGKKNKVNRKNEIDNIYWF